MAQQTRGSFGTRGSRHQTRQRREAARVRGPGEERHPYRWCPQREVTILVGPDFLCPACGKLTTFA